MCDTECTTHVHTGFTQSRYITFHESKRERESEIREEEATTKPLPLNLCWSGER